MSVLHDGLPRLPQGQKSKRPSRLNLALIGLGVALLTYVGYEAHVHLPAICLIALGAIAVACLVGATGAPQRLGRSMTQVGRQRLTEHIQRGQIETAYAACGRAIVLLVTVSPARRSSHSLRQRVATFLVDEQLLARYTTDCRNGCLQALADVRTVFPVPSQFARIVDAPRSTGELRELLMWFVATEQTLGERLPTPVP